MTTQLCLDSNLDSIAGEISSMTTEQLREELARGLRITAENLLRLAFIVKALEDRGEDLAGLRIGLLHHLRRIACGQVLPEVIVRFAGTPSLIAIVGNLPIPEQRRLAAGEPVRLLVSGPNGHPTHRLADPLSMTREQVSQVFARDHIRDESEQALLLDQRKARALSPVPDRVGQLRIDRERGGVTIGRKFIPLSDLVAAVTALRK